MRQENLLFKIWRIIYPVLFHYICKIIIVAMAFSLFMIQIKNQLMDEGADYAADKIIALATNKVNDLALVITIVINLVALPALLLFLKKDSKRVKQRDFAVSKIKVKDVVFVAIMSGIAAIVLNIVVSMMGVAESSAGYQEVTTEIYSVSLFIRIISVVIVAPLVEEVLFRGLLYGRIKEYTEWRSALIISSAIFGIYHGNIVQGVYAGLLGCIFVLVYERFGSIVITIFAHMFANSAALVLPDLVEIMNVEKYPLVALLVLVILVIILLVMTVFLLIRIKKGKENIINKL